MAAQDQHLEMAVRVAILGQQSALSTETLLLSAEEGGCVSLREDVGDKKDFG